MNSKVHAVHVHDDVSGTKIVVMTVRTFITSLVRFEIVDM